MINMKNNVLALLALILIAGCVNDKATDEKQLPKTAFLPKQGNSPQSISLTSQGIPGTPRSSNNETTGGYAPSHVEAQLKIDVDKNTRGVKVIRDNTDPFVITKPYVLKHADPFAVRGYLEAAVGSKSVNSSPAQVTAVKFVDSTAVVLVSAEDYRFSDSLHGKGIDSIVKLLDRPGLKLLPAEDACIYFPQFSRAANLREMLKNVGSLESDPQFVSSPCSLIVDGELNALIIKAPMWQQKEINRLLKIYDRPVPEMLITYRVLEIYAENDDRIGVDFQSWKNNEGVDFFSAGTTVRRNWGTFFTSGVQDTGNNRTSYWNFNPKWNTRYLDFLTVIGKAKCLAQGVLTARNRETSNLQLNSGFFYDRTYYTEGATSIAEACTEFTYTEPNPDTILRESIGKVMPLAKLNEAYSDMGFVEGKDYKLVQSGYTMRTMGTQTGTALYHDAIAKLAGSDYATSAISKWLTGYVKADGTSVRANYYNTDWNSVNAAPGIIHGWLQYPMVTDGFSFNLRLTPVITGKAAKLSFEMESISLLGWNSDGSARTSKSSTSTMVQVPDRSQDFVIGGLRKSESTRSTAGLPYLKDLPVIGRVFSTESESIKQSQLIVVARVEMVTPYDSVPPDTARDVGNVVKGVNKGMESRVGNMFFQQMKLDDDREGWQKRLDSVGNFISDDYQELK